MATEPIPITRPMLGEEEAAGRPGLAPRHLPARPGDVRRLLVDNGVLRGLIGFEPEVPFERGIAELVQWFRTRPWTPEQMLARMTDQNWGAVGAK